MPKKNKNYHREMEQRIEERTKDLEQSEAILRGFIEGTMDAICIRDKDRRLVLWNGKFANGVKVNCGVDVQVGMRAEDYIPEELFAQFDEQRKKLYTALQGEPTHAEYAYPSKNGDISYFDVRWTPVYFEGKIFGVAEVSRDVTDQKAFHQRLQETERRYRTVAEFTYDWEYWESPEGEMLYVSPSCERISGYETKAFLDNSDLLEQIIDPEDVGQWKDHRHDARTRTESTEIQFRIHTKEGEIRWIEHACQPVYDEEGKFLGIRASNRDITSRKRTDEILIKNREYNRAILMSLKDHLAVLDADGIILSVNQSWLDFARENDVSSLELVGEGMNYLDVCRSVSDNLDKTAQRALQGIKQVLNGTEDYFDLEYPCHSPSKQRWFSMKVIPFRGEKGGVIVAHTEITSRKQTEEDLKKKDKLLEEAQTIAHLGSWNWNIATNELVWSDEVYRIFGLLPEKFSATYDAFLERVHPDDRSGVKSAIEQALNDPNTDYNIAHRIIIQDGSERIVRERGNVVFGKGGKPHRMIGTVQDITDIRMMEAETRKLRAEISHMDRVGMMGVLSAGISHEINQPLAAILSNAQAALRFLENDQPDLNEVKEALQDIVSDDKRAGEIVHSIRNMVGKADIEPNEIDINETIKEIMNLVKSEALERRITLSESLQEDLSNFFGNRVQIQQVILNLLMNGFDAIESAGTEFRKIMISTHLTDADSILLKVSDTGSGIKKDRIETIFDSFQTTKVGGLGIGLSICKSIAETHNGRIWAENRVEGGVSFFFELPLGEITGE